jgi:hypothetical protein
MSISRKARMLSILALLFASASAEAGQAQSWTTAIKITCDRTVGQANATNVMLCEDATCFKSYLAGGFDCGTDLGFRTTGYRIDTDFKPAVFSYTLAVSDQSARLMCSNSGSGIPVGTTVTCDGSRSPKLSVGRPH